MSKYKNCFFVCLLVLFFGHISFVNAQQSTKADTLKKTSSFGIKFKGFVKSDYWYDRRQVFTTREDLFLFYPLNIKADKNGQDINAQPTLNFTAMTSRLCGLISGPDAFGAKTSGFIEADFSGVSNADINGLRLRHAYGKLTWSKSELLFGQYWHPMFVSEVCPSVISLNTGAPFQPFNRNPQLSYTRFLGKFNLNAVFITQRDNSNDGPLSYSATYLRNALIPNVDLQLQYKGSHNVLGIAGDYKILRPRMVTDSLFATKQTIPTFAAMAYWKYTKGDFTWKCKAIFGQNLTEHLMLGGYAVKSIDSTSMLETYTPTNHLFVWGNALYTLKKKIQFGLFGGYAKNLGTTALNTGKYYARGSDIAYIYRVAPSVSFISNKTQISTELEYTTAAFGNPDLMGIVQNAKEVTNIRLLLTFFYFF